MIQAKAEDCKVEYYFVKSFVWKDEMKRLIFNGFPKPRSIQRVIHNTEANVKSMVFSVNNTGIDALLLNNPGGHDPEESPYLANLIHINKSSILDLDLTEEQLEEILSWESKNNEDITTWLAPKSDSISAIIHQEAEEIAQSIEILGELKLTNPHYFDLLLELASYLIDAFPEEDPARFLTISKTGMAVNISDAVRQLSTYTSGEKHGNERMQVLSAIEHLFIELERRDNLQLD